MAPWSVHVHLPLPLILSLPLPLWPVNVHHRQAAVGAEGVGADREDGAVGAPQPSHLHSNQISIV